MVASGGVLSEGYGHGMHGVCLSDGQTEAEGAPSQGGRGDALLRRMPPYLSYGRLPLTRDGNHILNLHCPPIITTVVTNITISIKVLCIFLNGEEIDSAKTSQSAQSIPALVWCGGGGLMYGECM